MSAGAAINALIAKNPGVVELRREHATIMRLPMIGTALAGDPGLQSYAHDQDAWRLCQYAAALAVKRGVVPADLAGLDGIFEARRTVVFVRADGAQTEIGRAILPAHVPDYTPLPPPDAAVAGAGDQGTTTIFVPSNEAGKMNQADELPGNSRKCLEIPETLETAGIAAQLAAAERRGYERGAEAAMRGAETYVRTILLGLIAGMELLTGTKAAAKPWAQDPSRPRPSPPKSSAKTRKEPGRRPRTKEAKGKE